MAHMQIAMGSGFIGLLFVQLAMGRYRLRDTWLYRCVSASAIFWLLLFPVGTVIGIVLLIAVYRTRKIGTSIKNEM